MRNVSPSTWHEMQSRFAVELIPFHTVLLRICDNQWMLSGNDTYALDLSFLYIIKTTPLAIAYLFHRTVCHSLVCVSLINDLHSTETPIQISMAINAVLSYCSFPAVHFRLEPLSNPITHSWDFSIIVSHSCIWNHHILNLKHANTPTMANGNHSQERSYENSWACFLHRQESARLLIFHFPYSISSNDQSLKT